jgi:hypothetical protein
MKIMVKGTNTLAYFAMRRLKTCAPSTTSRKGKRGKINSFDEVKRKKMGSMPFGQQTFGQLIFH